MNIITILTIVAGAVIAVLGFVFPGKEEEEAILFSEEEIRSSVDREIERSRGKLDSIVDESVTYAMEKTERSMEKLTNEKMTALGEYSETILSEIDKNHKEVLFMYDMLQDKHENLKDAVSEASRAQTLAREAAALAESAAKAVPETQPVPEPDEPSITRPAFFADPQPVSNSVASAEHQQFSVPLVSDEPQTASVPLVSEEPQPAPVPLVSEEPGPGPEPVFGPLITPVVQPVQDDIAAAGSVAEPELEPAPEPLSETGEGDVLFDEMEDEISVDAAADLNAELESISAQIFESVVEPESESISEQVVESAVEPEPENVGELVSESDSEPEAEPVQVSEEVPEPEPEPKERVLTGEERLKLGGPFDDWIAEMEQMKQNGALRSAGGSKKETKTSEQKVSPEVPLANENEAISDAAGSPGVSRAEVQDLLLDTEGADSKVDNEKILSLHRKGKSNTAIARQLGIGVGEVKLVIDLFEAKK